jgi:hypothetical protein
MKGSVFGSAMISISGSTADFAWSALNALIASISV